MTNPKTGKPQLSDYEHKGPPRKRKPVDPFSEDISALPNKEDVAESAPEDERTPLDKKRPYFRWLDPVTPQWEKDLLTGNP